MALMIGSLPLDGARIPIQTMLKNPVRDIDTSIARIARLAELGCDIIRIAVPDRESAEALRTVVAASPIPVVADIHFDYRLAEAAMEAGVHKVRINPGNIGGEDRVRRVIDALKEHRIPVRIGINGGSLPRHLGRGASDRVAVMIAAAREELAWFEKNGYDRIVLSFKSSSVTETVAVNRRARELFSHPLHIGVTEAGHADDGIVKNAAGIGALLLAGIGETVRVSLTAPEEAEVRAAASILAAVGRRTPPWEIISCPTCGRTGADIGAIVGRLREKLEGVRFRRPLTIAVMGCAVNGPGEASHADCGVAVGAGTSVLFKGGVRFGAVENGDIFPALMRLLEDFREGTAAGG